MDISQGFQAILGCPCHSQLSYWIEIARLLAFWEQDQCLAHLCVSITVSGVELASITICWMHWSRGWSCTDHLEDHALITWLITHSSCAWSCTDHLADNALITKLIIHWSHYCACTDHVADLFTYTTAGLFLESLFHWLTHEQFQATAIWFHSPHLPHTSPTAPAKAFPSTGIPSQLITRSITAPQEQAKGNQDSTYYLWWSPHYHLPV